MEQLNIVGPSMKSLSHSYRHDIFGDGNGDDGGGDNGNGDDGDCGCVVAVGSVVMTMVVVMLVMLIMW